MPTEAETQLAEALERLFVVLGGFVPTHALKVLSDEFGCANQVFWEQPAHSICVEVASKIVAQGEAVFLQFLARVEQQKPTGSSIVAHVRSRWGAAASAAPPTGAPSPHDLPHFLAGGRPFVDRRAYRDAVRAMDAPGGKPVLVLLGDPETGKSWSENYLCEVVDVEHSIDLEDYEGVDGHMQVCDFITDALGLERVDLSGTETTLKAGLNTLRSRLKLGAKGEGPLTWFFIDSADDVLTPSMGMLLAALIDTLVRDDCIRVRLVLAGSPADAPPDLRFVAAMDRPEGVHRDRAEEWLRGALAEKGCEVQDDTALRARLDALFPDPAACMVPPPDAQPHEELFVLLEENGFFA